MTAHPLEIPPRPRIRAIALGASAGGLQPLREIVNALPADLAAVVFVVLHVSATGTSVLPEILGRYARLRVTAARDGMVADPGLVIVAPPNQHLIAVDGCVHLSSGPRENGLRPAVDPLFRSMAEQHEAECCGVVLSGTRDDGAAGLSAIRANGGVAIVQDPEEAQYRGMPEAAMDLTAIDAVLPASDIPAALEALVAGAPTQLVRPRPTPPLSAYDQPGEATTITCPECGGTLTEQDLGGVPQFRCHVGHTFAPASLFAEHTVELERAMWKAVRTLEDRASLLTRLADQSEARQHTRSSRSFREQAARALRDADAVRDVLLRGVDDHEHESVKVQRVE